MSASARAVVATNPLLAADLAFAASLPPEHFAAFCAAARELLRSSEDAAALGDAEPTAVPPPMLKKAAKALSPPCPKRRLPRSRPIKVPANAPMMMPQMARPAFQSLLGQIDVLLDPLHFGGGQTTLEAIAAGTPVVTLPSPYRRGRLSLAYLTQAGVTDTVASDVADYVARANALGRDAAGRAALGERLVQGSRRVFDNDAAVRAFEQVMRGA